MTTDNFCFYLQNRLIQTSQTGGQCYSDTSPLVFLVTSLPGRVGVETNIFDDGTSLEDGLHLAVGDVLAVLKLHQIFFSVDNSEKKSLPDFEVVIKKKTSRDIHMILTEKSFI
jgi:hypothetical protein